MKKLLTNNFVLELIIMKYFFIILLVCFTFYSRAQVLNGRILNAQTNEPLEYAAIGVVGQNIGTISNENGEFNLDFKQTKSDAQVRISMIGFYAQVFSVQQLKTEYTVLKLKPKTYEIAEIIVNQSTEKKVGAVGFNRFAGWSGWRGYKSGIGVEMGTIVDLGSNYAKLKTLHIYFHKQAFDTVLLRLHIRKMIQDSVVQEDLLRENILFLVVSESGVSNIDLDKYDLFLRNKIAVTLEWVSATGLNPNREIRVNGKIEKAYILFKNKKRHAGLYRWGPEAKWQIFKDQSPSVSLTVLQ